MSKVSKVSKKPIILMPTVVEDKAITAAARSDHDAQPLTLQPRGRCLLQGYRRRLSFAQCLADAVLTVLSYATGHLKSRRWRYGTSALRYVLDRACHC